MRDLTRVANLMRRLRAVQDDGELLLIADELLRCRTLRRLWSRFWRAVYSPASKASHTEARKFFQLMESGLFEEAFDQLSVVVVRGQ